MYVCQDFKGNWFVASEFLEAALDRESVRSPVNVPLALTVTLGRTKTGRYPCATHGDFRMVDYRSAGCYQGGYEVFQHVEPFGWLVADEVPEDVEQALCFALGIEYIP